MSPNNEIRFGVHFPHCNVGCLESGAGHYLPADDSRPLPHEHFQAMWPYCEACIDQGSRDAARAER